MTTLAESKYVCMNIGGTVIKTLSTTCKAIKGSLLESLDNNSEHYDEEMSMYYFDRDAHLFMHILASHRDGIVHVPRDICPIRFRDELQFWRIPQKMVAPCCWKYFYKCDEDIDTLKEIIKSLPNTTFLNKIGNSEFINPIANSAVNKDDPTKVTSSIDNDNKREHSIQQRIWLFLEEPRSSKAAKIWCFTYMFVVLLSIVLNIIWLDESVRVQPYLTPFLQQFSKQELYEMVVNNETLGNAKMERLVLTDPHPALFTIDCLCIGFFALETIVHFVVCPRKLLYFKSLYNLLKIFLSFCMTYGVIFEIRKDLLFDIKFGYVWFVFKTANTLRALLILRLHKLYSNLNLIYLSMRRSLKEMVLLLLMFGLTIVVYGGLVFATEIESEMFADSRTAMWWALITMTTIGYGDYYPTDTMGYLVGLLCAINGLIVIALPIAAISSNFSTIYGRNSDLNKHFESIEKEDGINKSAEDDGTDKKEFQYCIINANS